MNVDGLCVPNGNRTPLILLTAISCCRYSVFDKHIPFLCTLFDLFIFHHFNIWVLFKSVWENMIRNVGLGGESMLCKCWENWNNCVIWMYVGCIQIKWKIEGMNDVDFHSILILFYDIIVMCLSFSIFVMYCQTNGVSLVILTTLSNLVQSLRECPCHYKSYTL